MHIGLSGGHFDWTKPADQAALIWGHNCPHLSLKQVIN